jgi:phosphatidylglycerophosphatase C
VRAIAFFDLDGTLTRRDTLPDFIRHSVGLPRFLWGAAALSPMLAAYAAGLVSNARAKECLVAHFYKNADLAWFKERGERYSRERLPALLRHEGIKRVKWHLAAGHEVVIVSASIETWIEGWSQPLGLGLLATKLEADAAGRLTGRFASPNCHGEEKVRRIRESYALEKYGCIYAYGDSNGDQAMLDLAQKPFFRPFHMKGTEYPSA